MVAPAPIPATEPGRRLALWLTFLAGYVDTAGYVALQGLFTAHVTGNFVTIGASLLHGTTGSVVKIAALPVFCGGLVLWRVVTWGLPAGRVMRVSLVAQAVLLALGGVEAGVILPGHHGDSWQEILTGLTLVAAMSIQNGLQRLHLPRHPPGTLMTGTTTQVWLDVAVLLRGSAAERTAARARFGPMGRQVLIFAAGCAAGAAAVGLLHTWCFLPAVAFAVGALRHVPQDEGSA